MQTSFFILISNFVPTIIFFYQKTIDVFGACFQFLIFLQKKTKKKISNVTKQKHDSSLFVNFIFAIDSNAIF